MSMAHLGFYVDMKRCVGCMTCQIACKDKFDLDVGEFGRRVARYEGGAYPAPFVYSVSLSCGHCDDPACVKVCPAGAMTKDAATGLVLHDQARCIGCRSCEAACPYGAPTYVKATGKVTKCNGCKDKLDAGKPPLCVSGCRVRALEFGDIDALKAAHPGWVGRIREYADPARTSPNVIFKPRREAL
ncbi:MAG: 4Fe-4S dicluster domain-containing protein [Acidobacteriota bacterium]